MTLLFVCILQLAWLMAQSKASGMLEESLCQAFVLPQRYHKVLCDSTPTSSAAGKATASPLVQVCMEGPLPEQVRPVQGRGKVASVVRWAHWAWEAPDPPTLVNMDTTGAILSRPIPAA